MKHQIFFAILFGTLASLAAYPAIAMAQAQEIVALSVIQIVIDVGAVLATLTGVASLISVIVNILKYFKLIQVGSGGQWFAGLNLLAFAALVAFRIFAPQYSLALLDGYAGQVAIAFTFITGYVFQLGSGQAVYEIIKRLKVPILSYSDTNNPMRG